MLNLGAYHLLPQNRYYYHKLLASSAGGIGGSCFPALSKVYCAITVKMFRIFSAVGTGYAYDTCFCKNFLNLDYIF